LSNFKNSLYQTSSVPKSVANWFLIAPINLETAPSTGAPSIGIRPFWISLSNLLKSLKVFLSLLILIVLPFGALKNVSIAGYLLKRVFFDLWFNCLIALLIIFVLTFLPPPVSNKAVYLFL